MSQSTEQPILSFSSTTLDKMRRGLIRELHALRDQADAKKAQIAAVEEMLGDTKERGNSTAIDKPARAR